MIWNPRQDWRKVIGVEPIFEYTPEAYTPSRQWICTKYSAGRKYYRARAFGG